MAWKGRLCFDIQSLTVILSTLLIAECSVREAPRRVNSRINEEVTLTCPVTGTFVNWYKDGVQMTDNADIRLRKDQLKIKSIKSEDQGFYSCKGIDGFSSGQPMFNFTLYVFAQDVSTFPADPPSVTEHPLAAPTFDESPPGNREIRHGVGATPKIRCRASGYPEPQITWYKDGREIDRMVPDYKIEGFGLKFESLRPQDQGQYMCKVSNSIGTINFTYTVTVLDPHLPTAEVIPPYPLNTSVTYGSSASLQCKVKSNTLTSPTIMWLKLESGSRETRYSYIQINDKFYRLISNETAVVETEEGAYINRLVIHNVRESDAGIYICIGLNQGGGSDKREAHISVIRTTTTTLSTVSENTWEYIFGSPSATLAVLIAIPVVIILIVTICIIYGLNKRKKNTGIRRPPANMMIDHEVAVPLNMNANNGCYSGQYAGGSTSSYNKVPLSNGDTGRYSDKMYQPPPYRSPTPQQYSQYFQSDGSYRSSLHYPPAAVHHQQQQQYMTDIPDSDSHFSSVSHTRPQYMPHNRNPYDDRDIHSDPPTSRVGHHCPPAPPGSYYSGQW